MNALDCTDIKALLSALIDDRLDEHTRHQVERHLAGCEACCAQISAHERVEQLIAMGGEIALHAKQDLPRGFEDEVLARTVRAVAPKRSVFRGAATWTGWLAAAASIALAALIWIDDQRAARTGDVAVNDPVNQVVSPLPHEPTRRHVRPASYSTGMNLQSSVYDGPFDSPSQLMASAGTILGDPVRAPLAEFAFEPSPSHPHTLSPSHFHDRSAPAITREEADSIYHVSLMMHLLADADLTSFEDVERVRRVVLADELIERLSETRQRVDAADRPVLLAAEAVLVRVVEGPLDREDVRHLSETIARLDLPGEVGSITERWDRAYSM